MGSVSMTAQDVPYRVTWWGMALLLVSHVHRVSTAMTSMSSARLLFALESQGA